MNRMKTLALVCLILLSSVAGGLAVNPVVAQEDTTSGDETPTDTPDDESDDEDDDSGESNETDSGDGEDDVIEVEPGDLDGDGETDDDQSDGQSDESENSDEEDGETITIDFGDVSEVDSSPEEVDAQKIAQDMGGGVHIYDVRWNEEEETVTFKLRTPRSLNLAITDSNSVDPDATGGHFQQSNLDVSRGTYEVTFSATVRGGSQIITITGAPNPTYIQSPDDSKEIVPTTGPRWVAWGGSVTGGLFTLVVSIVWRKRSDANKIEQVI